MMVREIVCKSVLNKSGIPGVDYCVNPYTGCSHACRYCYASFMKKYTGHREPWGSFVDAKVNAADVLERQLVKAAKGQVYMSSVTDPYQPAENRYGLTRKCLEILLKHQFPVSIQTKSSLVLRDMDIIKKFKSIEVGFTICMDDGHAAGLEPGASPPSERVEALRKLHEAGIRTYVFIGPVIPGVSDAAGIVKKTYGWTGHYFIDRLNMKGCALGMERPSDGYYERLKKELSIVLKGKSHTFCY